MTMGDVMRRVAVPQARRGRVEGAELATGLLVTGGAVLASALLSARFSPAPENRRVRRYYDRLEKPPFNPPDAAFAIWGPLFGLITLSGLRLWTAPRGPARSHALGHWFGIQALNAIWMVLGFGLRQRGAMAAEAVATVANAGAYVAAARRVDRVAAGLALPYLAWASFAALLSEELWRRNR